MENDDFSALNSKRGRRKTADIPKRVITDEEKKMFVQ